MLSKNIKIVMLTNFKHFWQNIKIDLLNHLIVKLNNCIATANIFVILLTLLFDLLHVYNKKRKGKRTFFLFFTLNCRKNKHIIESD